MSESNKMSLATPLAITGESLLNSMAGDHIDRFDKEASRCFFPDIVNHLLEIGEQEAAIKSVVEIQEYLGIVPKGTLAKYNKHADSLLTTLYEDLAETLNDKCRCRLTMYRD